MKRISRRIESDSDETPSSSYINTTRGSGGRFVRSKPSNNHVSSSSALFNRVVCSSSSEQEENPSKEETLESL
jgi:hypothetical protein